MGSPVARRLGLFLLAGLVVFGIVFALPAITPKGSNDAYPAWRSIEGVPVLEELPDGFVGVLRIARERNSEQARISIVLGPDAPCAGTTVAVGEPKKIYEADLGPGAEVCRGLRMIGVVALPGPVTVKTGDTTWSLDPSARDPRSCQLSRDRTCGYWLFDGGRFGETVAADAERVQSNQPSAAAAVDLAVPGDGHGSTWSSDASETRLELLCLAAASPRCTDLPALAP